MEGFARHKTLNRAHLVYVETIIQGYLRYCAHNYRESDRPEQDYHSSEERFIYYLLAQSVHVTAFSV